MLRLGARPLPAFDGRQLFLIAIADVTERRRLRQVREAAQRERESFLNAVSHELRTPLSAIILWAQALRDGALDGPRRGQAIDTILESAQSEAHLIDDLMELALSQTNELRVNLESIEPASIVLAAVEAARAVATAKRVAIETALVSGARIDADPRRLQQIASNLITNAIKFTPSGGNVSVSLEHTNGSIELRVRDSGPGIAPEFLPHAFDPFTQADRSSTREQNGLGIGLALVRHFVERQGGTIDVSSPGQGQGTTFTVHLPAAPTRTSPSDAR